jgi:hypothetical protein
VFWDGNLVADILNPANAANNGVVGPWVQYSFNNLLATSGSTVLEVHGRQDPQVITFDDFNVTPEPATLALVGLGLGLAGLGLSRRKQ